MINIKDLLAWDDIEDDPVLGPPPRVTEDQFQKMLNGAVQDIVEEGREYGILMFADGLVVYQRVGGDDGDPEAFYIVHTARWLRKGYLMPSTDAAGRRTLTARKPDMSGPNSR